MSTKKFGGFTEEQMAAIAKHMGHSGPMEKFNDFLNENPDRMTTLSRMTKMAQDHVEGIPHMAKGGKVSSKDAVEQAKANLIYKGGGIDLTTSQGINAYNAYNAAVEASGKPASPVVAPGKDGLIPGVFDNEMPIADKSKDTGFNMQGITETALNKPEGAVSNVKTSPIVAKPGEFIDPKTGQVSPNAPQATTTQATTSTANTPNQTGTHTASTATTKAGVNQATEDLQGVHGTVSQNSQVQAQTALPSANATVQGQMAQLMAQFAGGETPPWAAGALRKANEAAAGRGLGQSSVALSATTQAAMESALGIAIQDATTYSAFEMKNLDNRQQAALVNAQSFLAMDMANLNNDQQANLLKTQLRTQALFTDAAAENATRQFNATSQNQTDQFFASLKTQVSQFNAAQRNATSQFNAGEKNVTSKFNATIRDQREQFNAQNRLIIDQSNATWRRTISTTNNANLNEANRINAQAATGLTMAAYNNLWQKERDLMSYAFTASENSLTRAHEIILQKKGSSQDQNNAMWNAAGNLVGNMFKDFDFGSLF